MATSSVEEWNFLYWLFTGFSVAIAILVYVWLIGAGIIYRRKAGAKPSKHDLQAGVFPYHRGSRTIEVGWTLASFVVAMVLTWFSIVGLEVYDAVPEEGTTIVVSAHQFGWTFTYENGTEVNDDLQLTCGVPTKFLVSSTDVVHAFFIPAFKIKADAFPDRVNVAWTTPGETSPEEGFNLQCAEYCGNGHSHMTATVHTAGSCG